MVPNNEREYLGRDGTEQLVATVKNLINEINNTAYTHPTYTSKSSGLYKITVDGTGHVSGATAVAKSDITALGIPAQDTTYSVATTNAAGLMSTSDKSKLDGIDTITIDQINDICGVTLYLEDEVQL